MPRKPTTATIGGGGRRPRREKQRQRNHEQRPAELQRHGIAAAYGDGQKKQALPTPRGGRARDLRPLVRNGSSGSRAKSGSTKKNPIKERKNKISMLECGRRDTHHGSP